MWLYGEIINGVNKGKSLFTLPSNMLLNIFFKPVMQNSLINKKVKITVFITNINLF